MTITKRALRALVVAYDFPPHAAIGTMRTLRLVRGLAQAGWDVTVLTSSPATYASGTPIDPMLEAQVPETVRIIRARAFRGLDTATRATRRLIGRNTPRPPASSTSPGGAAHSDRPSNAIRRVKDFLEAALAIPDNESGWILPAVLRGLCAAVKRGRPDVIYSSAPPWSGQVVALALATVVRRPWVADFRDPWARAPWRDWRRPFRQRAAAFLERHVVGYADRILFVTQANLAEFASFYGPEVANRFQLVPNGCDPSELHDITSYPSDGPFVLLHAGTLYGARNPLPLIHAIARAVNRGALARDSFRLRLLGPINLSVDLATECRRLGLGNVVEFVPRVTRNESLREMVAASALLLVQPVTTVSIPGKAYEYLAAGRPLLALAEEGETAELVRASGIGVSVPPDAGVEAIENALLSLIATASKPYAPAPLALYDGRVHAATTAELLAQLAVSEPDINGNGSVAISAASRATLQAEDPHR